MGLFKSPEEKAHAQALRSEKRFAESPVGRATTAFERGDQIFQAVLKVDREGTDTICRVEAIGWRLDHVGYTFTVSASSTTNSEGALADVQLRGDLIGVYLFRRGPSVEPTSS